MARAGAAKGLRLLLRSVALWLALLGASTATASKAVTAHLAAKWPETPLLLEARWVPRPGERRRRGVAAGGGTWHPRDIPSGKMLLRSLVPSDQGPFRSDVHPVRTPPLGGVLPPNPSIPLHLRSSGASPRPLSIRSLTLHPFKPSGSLIQCFLFPLRALAP